MIIDELICKRNLHSMVQKATRNRLTLRPHFKTHQSAEIGDWFRAAGIKKITVSSVGMAEYFVAAGWQDITIAFPMNLLEWHRIHKLAEQIDLQIIIASEGVLENLPDGAGSVGAFIKVDVGTHRTGIDPTNHRVMDELVAALMKRSDLQFKGFLAHAGHSYACRDKSCVQLVHDESRKLMIALRNRYSSQVPGMTISLGDTPTCSICEGWEGVDEIRPGNFIFYDLTQWLIGSCGLSDIAVALACPVVAKHRERKTIIVYGGGVHLSKDRMEWQGKVIYGLPVLLSEDGWSLPDEESCVVSLSQEHGVIQASSDLFDRVGIGDILGILPVHSCMACDLMKKYQVIGGKEIQMMTT